MDTISFNRLSEAQRDSVLALKVAALESYT